MTTSTDIRQAHVHLEKAWADTLRNCCHGGLSRESYVEALFFHHLNRLCLAQQSMAEEIKSMRAEMDQKEQEINALQTVLAQLQH
ncbi:MAG: hypothetical protein NVS3B25_24280 [Hymenobacter sp.]